MDIRSVRLEDLQSLAALAESTWLDTFSDGLTAADVDAALSERDFDYFLKAIPQHSIFVAVVGEVLAGFIECIGEKDVVTIDKLYVANAFQGQGIGRALMTHLVSDPNFSSAAMQLDVWIENTTAISLYQSFGFEVYAERPFISANGDVLSPDLLMRREPKSGLRQ